MESVSLRNVKEQSYSVRESLRALRTNIEFCGDDIRTILFTSTAPDEGKSTVVYELARSIASAGKTVLLIDTDMRKSVMVGRHRAKSVSGQEIYGLSHYLSGQKNIEQVLYATNVTNLFMIFAGRAVPNPTEILEKRYFDDLLRVARKTFNCVLIDCAPLGAAIDAAAIAKKCDGAVFVIAQGQVSGRAVASAEKQLEASGVKILGAVLNKVKLEKSHYGKYYGNYYGKYYGSYYGDYYGSNDGKKKENRKDRSSRRSAPLKSVNKPEGDPQKSSADEK